MCTVAKGTVAAQDIVDEVVADRVVYDCSAVNFAECGGLVAHDKSRAQHHQQNSESCSYAQKNGTPFLRRRYCIFAHMSHREGYGVVSDVVIVVIAVGVVVLLLSMLLLLLFPMLL